MMHSIKVNTCRLLLPLIILIAISSFVSAQEAQRVVLLPEFRSSSNGKALEIVDVRVAGSSVELGHPFAANDDWLSSLSFRVKNITGKPLRFIRMGFSMLETKMDDKSLGFSFTYGTPCSTNANPPCDVKNKESKLVMPDEEVDMKFNEKEYQRNQDFILKRAGITKINRILVGIASFQFEDGTNAWTQDLVIRNKGKVEKNK
jgi:hypothetical protein